MSRIVNSIPKLQPLEKEKLWREACELTEYFYSLLDKYPQEESYITASKLRMSSVDFLYSVSQALANVSRSGREYDWSNARRALAGAKTLYRFSSKQEFIELDPEIMVRIDAVLKEIDERVVEAYKDSDAMYEREITAWQKKYEAWKAGNED